VENKLTRNWDWLMGVLVFLLMQVCAARLVTTNWAANLYFSEALAGLGAALGLALGASRFRRSAVVWLTIGYTLTVVPWQISGASTQKLLGDRLQEVGGILNISMWQFLQRQPVKNPLFFVAFVCLAYWLLAVAAGYWAARHRNILAGIIPSGIIVLVVQVYANYQLHGSWWLGLYLLLALLLIGRVYYLESEKVWSQRRVYVNDEAWTNILGGLFTVVAAVILLAWLFPTSISSVQAATDAWTRVTRSMRDRLSNAVTSLNGPYGRPGVNFYGTSLALGQNAAIGDAPVFTVTSVKAPDSYLRYYWRGRVYDDYSGGQWSTSSSNTLAFSPESGDIRAADTTDRSVAQLRFTLQFPTQTLIYAPSVPVWLDRPANVQVTPVEEGLDDILSWQARTAISNGSHYEVRAEIANPNVEQLRAAQTTYPRWVQDRYLEVPDNLKSKFQDLAQKVTAGQQTPYDKTVAITNYLRANLQYTTSLPPVPEGRDPVEWVLFSYKKGFCNYYASAEVLMLRSIGVPARLAVGFAQGEYQSGTYIVRRRDAHAWPEVFFPGFGWLEFEPTVSQQALVRIDPSALANAGPNRQPNRPRGEPDEPPALNPSNIPTPITALPLNQTLGGRVLMIAASMLALAFLLYLLIRFRVMAFVPVALARAFESSGVTTPVWIENWLLWNRLEPVEQAFASINWSLQWLGKPAPLDATPAERTAALKTLLPAAQEDIGAVASELETGLFTPQAPNVPRARQAALRVVLQAVRTRLGNLLGV
jgi:transglutaminase-like putative cysteine protease